MPHMGRANGRFAVVFTPLQTTCLIPEGVATLSACSERIKRQVLSLEDLVRIQHWNICGPKALLKGPLPPTSLISPRVSGARRDH